MVLLGSLSPSQDRILVEVGKQKILNEDDYDPHLHRPVSHPTTNLESFIHLLKAAVGTGILAMPEAFKNSGIWCGIFATFLCGLILTYCLHMLFRAEYLICKLVKVPILTYGQALDIAFQIGPKGLKKFAPYCVNAVDVILIVYQIGSCCIYVVFVAENLKAIVDNYTYKPIPVQIYMLLLLIPFMIINSIPNLKYLAPLSTIANFLTIISFGCILYYTVQDLPDLNDRPAFNSITKFGLYFGTALFAIESLAVFMSVEMNMKNPKDFTKTFGLLNCTNGLVTIFYTGVAFLGYWKYGEDIQASITLNLPGDKPLVLGIRGLYSIAIFISFSLQCYVPVQIIWESYVEKCTEGTECPSTYKYMIRVLTVLVTYFFSVAIPLLGPVISIVGSFSQSLLSIILPAIMDICVYYPDYGPYKLYLYKNLLLILLGGIGLLVGSYVAAYEIIKAFYEGKV